MPAVAQTDHGNLFGSIEFYEKARAKLTGVKPIIGCEVYLASGSRLDREKRERTDSAASTPSTTCCCSPWTRPGYRNLMQLVSKAYLEGFYYKPRIDIDLLRQQHEGLIATSRLPVGSMIPRAICAGETRARLDRAEEFQRLFGDRFYLELQRHGIPDQDTVNAELAKMASDLRIPCWRPTTPTTWTRRTTTTTTRCSASARPPTSTTRTASASTARAST